jgi:hypothetical protein
MVGGTDGTMGETVVCVRTFHEVMANRNEFSDVDIGSYASLASWLRDQQRKERYNMVTAIEGNCCDDEYDDAFEALDVAISDELTEFEKCEWFRANIRPIEHDAFENYATVVIAESVERSDTGSVFVRDSHYLSQTVRRAWQFGTGDEIGCHIKAWRE